MSSIHGRANHRYIPAERQPYSSLDEYNMYNRHPALQAAYPFRYDTAHCARYEPTPAPRRTVRHETRHDSGYASVSSRHEDYERERGYISPSAYAGHYHAQPPAPSHLYSVEPQYPRHVTPARSHYDRIAADLSRHPNRERERQARRREQQARQMGAHGSLVDPSRYAGHADSYAYRSDGMGEMSTRRVAPEVVGEARFGSRWSVDSSAVAERKSSRKKKGLLRRMFG